MTLKELADHLGLSPTTVSRALNGYPEVSESTRQRVQRAARKYNYRASHNARQLATGRASTIGHVVARSRVPMFGPLFSDVLSASTDAASRRGYDTNLRIVDDADEDSYYRDIAASGRCDGVIVHGLTRHDSRIPVLLELGLPFIVHGRSNVAHEYAWLDVDNAEAAREGTDHLAELGHRRIALINGPEELHFAMERRAGFCRALEQHELEVSPAYLFSGEMSEQFGYAIADALIRDDRLPDAMFVSGLLPAFGVLRALRHHDLELVRDLSLVAFDDQVSWLSNAGTPPVLTTIASSIGDAGARLANALIDLIEGVSTTPIAEARPHRFVQGLSTRPV